MSMGPTTESLFRTSMERLREYHEQRYAKLEAENATLKATVLSLTASLASTLGDPAEWVADEAVPFVPVDPEEQRRLATMASDGEQCMIYRHGA